MIIMINVLYVSSLPFETLLLLEASLRCHLDRVQLNVRVVGGVVALAGDLGRLARLAASFVHCKLVGIRL